MANEANIMKLLQTLGGASSSYSQGSQMRQGGQPVLPKPEISMPDNLSPYAPGNNGGGPHAHKGGFTSVNGRLMPNSNAKPNEMSDEGAQHPVNQLAEYLTTNGGAAATAAAVRQRKGVDASLFLRGGRGMPNAPSNMVVAGSRG